MHQDVPLLADAKGPVRGLGLDGRVPPAVEVNHVRRRRQVQPRAPDFQGEHEERQALVVLKALDEIAALADGRGAVHDEARPSEHALEEERQRLRRLAELGEDQRLLLLVGDDLAQLAQARELPALLGRPRAVPEPLGRMIADLLEAHEIRQDDPPALDARRAIEVL